MSSPALFSNNRYLAGVNAQGLAVVHVTSGEILGRDGSIPNGSLLCADGDDFICLVQKNNTPSPMSAMPAELYRFTIDSGGRLVMRKNFSITGFSAGSRFTAVGSGTGNASAFFGTSDGSLVTASSDGRSRLLFSKEQTLITDAAVSGSTVAFISENGYIGFIPLDYQQLFEESAIHTEKNDGTYNRVVAFNAGTEQDAALSDSLGAGQFILWHDRNARLQPAIYSSGTGNRFRTVNRINARSPVHSISSFDGKILFLDTTGNLSVIAPFADKNPLFTFFSVGLMDAAFIDGGQIMLGRSAVSGNTPFMTINLNTGETVPLPHSSQAATALYRGGSGSIYAVTVSSQPAEDLQPLGETTGIRTNVILLDSANGSAGANSTGANSTGANAAASIKLIDFQGEDTQFSLAESPGGYVGIIAATIGGEGAIYSSGGIQKLDRTAGLPHRLLEGGLYLVSLDRDGNIAWHDCWNGRLAAVFSLHPSGWTLRTEKRTISGQIE
jgi:hypothetical protein